MSYRNIIQFNVEVLGAANQALPNQSRDLGTLNRGESVGPGANVEDERLLKPWHQKVGPLADGLVDHSAEPIEKHGALAAVNGVHRGVEHRRADSEAEGGASDVCEK
nr:hypothetical protein DEO72_LG6g131 [Ipomoea trifida]